MSEELSRLPVPAEPEPSPISPCYAGVEWQHWAPGVLCGLNGVAVVIQCISSIEHVIVKTVLDGKVLEVKREELTPSTPSNPAHASSTRVLLEDETEQSRAQAIEAAIAPYVSQELSEKDRNRIAQDFKVHPGTVKRWLSDYRKCGDASVFVRGAPGPKPGSHTIDPRVDAIIDAAISDHYEYHDGITVTAIFDRIEARCQKAGLSVPGTNTIQRRINTFPPERLPAHLRKHEKAPSIIVKKSDEPAEALAVTQVDHTVVDIPVNDPVTGKCIGLPWITVVIDVLTRVILGFILSLEAPSQQLVAYALHRAVFPKEKWLKEIGAEGAWPFFGTMKVVHSDNAGEFTSFYFQHAARRWKIDPVLRRLHVPQDGAHVERYCGTFADRVHLLRGANRHSKYGWNIKQRSEHTMRSLERWIAHETIAYNHDLHTQLGMSPAHAWERAWTREGSLRIPTYPRDERDFLISFLPGTSRVVTREGIEWQRLHYRCRELEPYIKSGVKQIFRYDYRDVTKIYFEPPQGAHIEVPWIHDNLPTMSVWEWKEVRRNVTVPTRLVDRQMVHRAREANRRAIEQLATTNQRARRRIARQREWEREQRASTIPNAPALPAPQAESIALANLPMLTGEILE